LDLAQVGAHPTTAADGQHRVRFGLYLPGILPADGYQLRAFLVHEQDQFNRAIPPQPVELVHVGGELGLWQAEVAIEPPAARPAGYFGQAGTYLYRYQLLRGGQPVVFWFSDPFARVAGLGSLSAFVAGEDAPFAWSDDAFRVPEVDDLVVYELAVAEFNRDFAGVVAQLDHLAGLGVKALELTPVTNVPEKVEWGYTPLGYFAPDDRLGGPAGMKRLVDACHRRGIAVILDAVYGHCHPDFAYNLVYRATGVPNPMLGDFAEQFAGLVGPDYTKAFAREFIHRVNEYWLDEYHIDGFRYDYVPGSYDGPIGVGYAELVHHTYRYTESIPRFRSDDGRSRVLQVAEYLAQPREILAKTYSNACWQNEMLDVARGMARGGPIPDAIGYRLDPELGGYPTTYENAVTGERLPVAPFQYVETHDHGRFVNEFGRLAFTDLVGEPYGDRGVAYRTQPYAIALLTAKGIPMLWQGQELGENWGLPGGADPRRILFERPVHWEYFYDPVGKALVRLYRILGALRRRHPALGSRTHLHYEDDANHRRDGVVVYRRQASTGLAQPGEVLIVILNFRDYAQEVEVAFPLAGRWADLIDAGEPHAFAIDVAAPDDRHRVRVPSNYGVVLAGP
jgi:1,4-alpha-glucan branching enzyme